MVLFTVLNHLSVCLILQEVSALLDKAPHGDETGSNGNGKIL